MASGMIAVAHGSDGAGSIRIPAAFCGLYGLKPSRGRVANAYGLPDRGILHLRAADAQRRRRGGDARRDGGAVGRRAALVATAGDPLRRGGAAAPKGPEDPGRDRGADPDGGASVVARGDRGGGASVWQMPATRSSSSRCPRARSTSSSRCIKTCSRGCRARGSSCCSRRRAGWSSTGGRSPRRRRGRSTWSYRIGCTPGSVTPTWC